MVDTISLGKQGKRVYTIGPERVYTIGTRDPEKDEGFHGGGVYFFLPCSPTQGELRAQCNRYETADVLKGPKPRNRSKIGQK